MDHPTIEQVVADDLRNRIIQGDLKPGAHLNEKQLARDFGVSSTPVREGIRRLADEGLVDVLPRRGAFVRELTVQDAFEMTVLREALEALAFRILARDVTDEDLGQLTELYLANRDACIGEDYAAVVETDTAFHDYIVHRTGNQRLMDFMRRLSVLRLALWLGRYKDKIGVSELVLSRDDHLPLLQALATRDPDVAEAAIREHVRVTHEEFVEWMANNQVERRSSQPRLDKLGTRPGKGESHESPLAGTPSAAHEGR